MQKKVIHLLFWKNKTHEEVSELLGIGRGNVSLLRDRALRKLKKALLGPEKSKVLALKSSSKEPKNGEKR